MSSFAFVPFLPLVSSTTHDTKVLEAASRVAPLLIPLSILDAVLPTIPKLASYYVLVDSPSSSLEQILLILDRGAHKVVTRDESLVGHVPKDRLVLQIDPSTSTSLPRDKITGNISAILVETPTLEHSLLDSFREAIGGSSHDKDDKDLFVLCPSTSKPDDFAAVLSLRQAKARAIPTIPLSLLSSSVTSDSSATIPIPSLFSSCMRTDRPDGLFTTCVTSVAPSSTLIGQVYTSTQAIAHSIATGKATYHSRSRGGLWVKGETSGATQEVVSVRLDCDGDAVEYLVRQKEGTGFCHKETLSCFGSASGLAALEETLKSRFKEAPEGSYTKRLFSDEKLLRAKVMEEAEELCEAQSKDDIAGEMADLVYFAFTRCISKGVGWEDVERVLDRRALKVNRRKGDAKPKWEAKINESTPAQPQPTAVANLEATTEPTANGSSPSSQVTAGQVSEDAIRCRTVDLAKLSSPERADLLKRPLIDSKSMISQVTPIVDSVRTGGEEALRAAVAKFDRCSSVDSLTINAPFDSKLMAIDSDTKAAIDQAYRNIRLFHAQQLEKEKEPMVVETMPGVVCSRFARPIDRVGLYVPGGTAILPSTALMLSTPAQVAGVSYASIATPPRPDGSISPEIVYIAHICGVNQIVKAGGAHAIAALAYGTEHVGKVDKIFGPGNQYVTAAKMLVSNDTAAAVAIDMPAGPSEVLVIADETCVPAHVAADLLSQAEHGPDSQVVLLAVSLPSEQLRQIESEIHKQALALPRCEIIRKSVAKSLIVQVRTLEEALAFSNDYAPEHLILHLAKASSALSGVRNAGSVFVGPYSPESCGDYASGTNHSLPTYGYARQFSGVSTLGFMKHITSQELTEAGLRRLGPIVIKLAEIEGLEAHANAVRIRLPKS